MHTFTTGMTSLDLISLTVFLAAWSLYTVIADHSPLQHKTISAAMDRQRLDWMQQARRRELRMLDSGILQILVTGISIFASTTIFVIGGLMAGMGYNVELTQAFASVPFATENTPELWSIKLGLLLCIFIYAFFKFAWAIRLANYCSILLGALADKDEADSEDAEKRTIAAAKMAALCGHHFNRGLRANFFALAAVGWIFSPAFMMLATLLVVLILIRREFASKAVQALRY